MKRLNPDYLETVARETNKCPYFTLISMEIKGLGWGESRLEVMVQEKHLQPFGTVHGGVHSALVDAAAFWAIFPQLDEGVGATTVEMKLNYLAPSSEGYMIAKGKSIRVGNTLCLGEASVEDEAGRLLAYGTETMMVIKDLKLKGFELPPKFLD